VAISWPWSAGATRFLPGGGCCGCSKNSLDEANYAHATLTSTHPLSPRPLIFDD
jgi:hypothetical protein